MTSNSEVSRRGASTSATAQPGSAGQRAQSGDTPIRPPVDIWEDKDGITLCADMPGVAKERLELRVDGNSLIIEGQVQLELSGKAEALYADIRSSVYRRTFSLSGELESGKIEAILKDGVLTVHIPKRAELRPRKIEVRTA